MKNETQTAYEWLKSLTIGEFTNFILIVITIIAISILVLRTFRGKADM